MFEFKENRRNIPEEELLDDVRRVAALLKIESVTMDQYIQCGNFHVSTLQRRFGNWFNVLDKAALPYNRAPINIPNEELFSNLADVWTKLGKQPSYNDLNKETSKFSVGTYENRFGSWNKALKAFVEYISGKEVITENLDGVKEPTKRTPRNINWRLRAKILIRDNCICQMCGTNPAKNPDILLHVDHIKPWSKGGETIEENLRTLCHICNIGKSDIEIE